MDNKQISIAIDGPAAAGKSTVAKIIAEKLGYLYIDTGAMYRTLTYHAIEKEVDVNSEEELMALLQDTYIELKPTKNGQLVYLNGKDISIEIRKSDVTRLVSIVSKHKMVREEMVNRQQMLARSGGVVMDGRDIGTHVLPNAEVKIFLLASVDERARRRHEENMMKGFNSDYEQLKKEIAERDKLDSEREISPLKKAEDAFEINTTSLNIDEVVSKIMELVKERLS